MEYESETDWLTNAWAIIAAFLHFLDQSTRGLHGSMLIAPGNATPMESLAARGKLARQQARRQTARGLRSCAIDGIGTTHDDSPDCA